MTLKIYNIVTWQNIFTHATKLYKHMHYVYTNIPPWPKTLNYRDVLYVHIWSASGKLAIGQCLCTKILPCMNTYILILWIQVFSFWLLFIFNFFIFLLTRPCFFCFIILLTIRSMFIFLFRSWSGPRPGSRLGLRSGPWSRLGWWTRTWLRWRSGPWLGHRTRSCTGPWWRSGSRLSVLISRCQVRPHFLPKNKGSDHIQKYLCEWITVSSRLP